jgi:putative nucleotidyltransferase with HDIG domain
MTTLHLPDGPWEDVRRIARQLDLQVWVVGGAVRDHLLGRPVHDWDFAVDRDALRLARAVADTLNGAYFTMDEERGTGRAILTEPNGTRTELDFALLRGADLESDLLARDLTINAMALNDGDNLVDPTGGQADLAAGRIRATHEGAFRDDPVRILRAVRMEAQLSTTTEAAHIDPQTGTWMQRDAALLALPSPERVRDEFMRLLALPGAARHVQCLDEFGLLVYTVPELESLKGVAQSPPHRFDVWQHTLLTVDTLEGVLPAVMGKEGPRGKTNQVTASPALADAPRAAWGDIARTLGQFAPDLRTHFDIEVTTGRDRALLLKLAALLHDVGKPTTQSQDEDGHFHFYNHEPMGAQIAAARLQELRFSRDEIERMRVLVGQHLRPAHLARAERVTRRAIYRYFRATGCAGVDVVFLSLADHLATWGPNLEEERWVRRLEVGQTLLTHCFEHYEETVDPAPLLSGNDLMDGLGLASGPRIGRLLEAIREAQAAGEISTREEALNLARRLVKSR